MRALATSLILAATWLAVPAAGASPPVGRDRDGDKVADRLEAAGGARDVVVRLRTDASAARVREVLASAPGARLGVRLPLVDAFAARATLAQIRELAARGDVKLVEPDRTATTFDVSSSEGFGVTRARVDIPGLDGNADGDEASYSKNGRTRFAPGVESSDGPPGAPPARPYRPPRRRRGGARAEH